MSIKCFLLLNDVIDGKIVYKKEAIMESINKSLENWLNEFESFSFADYERLPDLDLYMDQVITYLDRVLSVFQTSSLDKQITPSMINNYVKGEVLPSPIGKKYTKEHIALIEEICSLKQVLNLADIKQILNKRYENVVEKSNVFNNFNELNKKASSKAIGEAFKSLNFIDDNDSLGLTNMALENALMALSYLNIAKRILLYIRVYEDLEKLKEERKEKEGN